MSMTLSFTARVLRFGLRDDHVEVTLEHKAAAYRVSPDRDDFATLVGQIAAAWKSKAPVQIEVERGVEIARVALPPAAGA